MFAIAPLSFMNLAGAVTIICHDGADSYPAT
jgi:hypothetical protein